MINGGCIRPENHKLAFNVTDTSGKTEEKDVTCISFFPGLENPFSVCFGNSFCNVQQPDEMAKLISYIVENHAPTYLRTMFDLEEVRDEYELRANNMAFISRHGDIDFHDRLEILHVRDTIETLHAHEDKDGNGAVPSVCDIIEGTYYSGSHEFKNGLIESFPAWQQSNGKLSVCVHPYIPFVTTGKDGSLSASASGGPFFGIAPEDLEYAGKGKRLVCVWGHAGVTAQGAINFSIEVNKWKTKQTCKI